MSNSTLHIDTPSERLLDLARKLQADKNRRQEQLKSEWNKYFPEK